MKAILPCLCFFFSATLKAQTNFTNRQLPSSHYFVENKGQWPSDVLYLTRSNGMDAWITRHGVVYDFHRIKQSDEQLNENPLLKKRGLQNSVHRYGQVVEWVFDESSEKLTIEGTPLSLATENYFIGKDPSRWVQGARSYNDVWLKNLYPGIDVHYFFDNGHLRYDYVVHPGANPANISWQVRGADGIGKDEEGNLLMGTRFGNVTHEKLYAFQEKNGVRDRVNCAFKIQNGKVQFDVGTYQTQYDLIIDPQVWGTFLGGSNEDGINAAVVNSQGNVIVTGATSSTNFPVTNGAYDNSQGGVRDMFVAGISADGSTLLFSTFVGGSGDDAGFGITLDGNGNILIGGATASANFPVTGGVYDETFNGGKSDGVVLKMNSSGSALQFSSLIGGSGADDLLVINIDASNNIYVCGITESTNFPTSEGAFDRSFGGGSENFKGDGFVAKFNSSGSSLVYGTYLGGSSGDATFGMVVLADGSACLTGFTESNNFPSTPGTFDASFNGGTDVFVTRLNPTGTGLVFSTFVGGALPELGIAIAAASNNDLLVTGWGLSIDIPGLPSFPVTPGSYDVTYNGGDNDAFVFKLKGDGSSLLFSTWLGGNKTEENIGASIATDGIGNVVVTGTTSSPNFPTTAGAFDVSLGGTSKDAYITVLSADGKSLLYSSYVGGVGAENSGGLALGRNGQVALIGNTSSRDFPVTANAYDQSYNEGIDGYVVLMNLSSVLPVVLKDWRAIPVNNTYIQLQWTTATESNSRGFEIQRSTDGVDFEKIGWASAAGNSVSQRVYNHADRQAQQGVRYFYRLKQVDIDGKWVFSPLTSAQLSKVSTSVSIAPNPTKGNAFLITEQPLNNATLRIYNNSGMVVGEQARQSGSRITIPVALLPAGVYWVQVLENGNASSQVLRLVKE